MLSLTLRHALPFDSETVPVFPKISANDPGMFKMDTGSVGFSEQSASRTLERNCTYSSKLYL